MDLLTFPQPSTVFDREYGATLWRESSNALLLYLYNIFSEHFYLFHKDLLSISYMQDSIIDIEDMAMNKKSLPQWENVTITN